jgi:hypothetical protein
LGEVKQKTLNANTVGKTEISEWAKLQRADKYCQTLIEKIGVKAGLGAGDQTRLEAYQEARGQRKLEATNRD